VEIKQIVSSNSNVILTQQTCSQRSGMAAGGKRRALALYFSVRICCVFLMLKYRRESDLGLCMTSVLTKIIQLRSADFRFLNVFGRKIRRKSALRSCILFASTEVMHRPRSDSFLHFYIRTQKANSYGKINCYRSAFAYRSHARALAAGLPRQDHV